MEESLLIERLKKGDVGAFNELYTRYYKLLVVYAIQFVKDLQIAENVTQDVFVTVYEKRTTIEIHTSFKAFLYTAVRNQAFQYIRKEKKNQAFDDVNSVFDTTENYKIIDHVELSLKLYKAVEKLPKQNQEIFRLSKFEGESNEFIARKMGLTKRTVETHISNALKRLRGILQTLNSVLVFLATIFYVLLVIFNPINK